MPAMPMSADLASELASAALTYEHPGATRGTLPAGYHHQHVSRVIGSGADVFASASAALVRWEAHLRAGLRVAASAPVAEPGVVVVLGIGAGPLRVRAPCRVVYVVSEPRRQGFGYGTLPGHPESGEESFVLERRDDDLIALTIRAFSRPASVTARVAGPLGRLIQLHITRRYLGALVGADGGGHPD
jgi:uncharacterized protein (UPF0548 family)